MIEKTTVLKLTQVTKKFRRFAAVSKVSFAVGRGEVVGFVGENGAGKTTTINMLLGFTSPTRGGVQVFDQDITPAAAHVSHRKIGYAAGDMELPKHMTGAQYIHFVMAQSGGKKHIKRYEELVKTFRPQLEKRIGTLSRGNKQKIALVAAFVTEPELVILDEPTSGLDPVMQGVFLAVVRDEAARGTTIFMSSHYLQEVAEVCTRVILMKDGSIVEDLSAEQLAERGGKVVTLKSRKEIKPPEHARWPSSHVESGVYVLAFGYVREIPPLLKWLAIQEDVIDVDISEHTLEEEFKHIYSGQDNKETDDE